MIAFTSQDGADVDVDVRELIKLAEATERLGLGPNGGLVFCIEYLASNLEWLKSSIDALGEGTYLLIDCPGQVRFCHNSTFFFLMSCR